eukprot:gene14598-19604_t
MFSASCQWHENGPVLFHIKTKLGVNYDAGHLFHMAENILTQHSVVRALENNGESNKSNIRSNLFIFNFDKDGFIKDLNPLTRFIVYLGTSSDPLLHINPNNDINQKQYYFMHIPKLTHIPPISSTVNGLLLNRTLSWDELRFFDAQVVNLDSNVPPTKRFFAENEHRNSHKSLTLLNSSVCVKVIGSIGGVWPTVQRGHWFPNQNDVLSLRKKIRNACPPDDNLIKQNTKKKLKKLLIYQRNWSRKIENQEETIELLKLYLQSSLQNDTEWEIMLIYHDTNRSPCELAHLLYNVDVFITPHGFQSMLLFFLPLHAIVFEVFPYKYQKRGYALLTSELGQSYGAVMSPPTTWHTKFLLSFITTTFCMSWKECRSYARNNNVIFTKYAAQQLVQLIEKNQCLQKLSQLSLETNKTNDTLKTTSIMKPIESCMQNDLIYE